ncbi:hypothetical protein NQ318_021879 [Aromia moschata]|uniref:Sphingomyelin phosphodiesterase C-terminal domain-containing protein n=1 Tax=Aromia moschata TaxID=1265417 RepID=A0AAV8Z9B8_9CUCU|nr:hypothetical protein NQ318_021879 [Aromia moschata]
MRKQRFSREVSTPFRPEKGFRVVVLNSNVCYVVNWWLLNEDEDPYGQLAWLVETLLAAEEAGESVHILMHVPTGNSECLTVWSREFNRIIERFANTIVGHFNGHTHRDELLVYYNSSDSSQAINVAWNGASLTTFTQNNPSYKILQIDDETFDLLDFEEWMFNLTLANSRTDRTVDWYKLYSFKDAYGVDSLEPSDIDNLLNRMTKDHDLLLKYYTYKYRDSPRVANNPCDANCQKNLLCDMTTTVRGKTEQCEKFSNLYDQNS